MLIGKYRNVHLGAAALTLAGLRLATSFADLLDYGSHHSSFIPSPFPTHRLAATLVFLFSALLDALDGYAARSLNQTSSLGIILDVIADNILRSCMWCASLLVNPSISLPAIIIITIEWLTFLSSQVAVLTEGGRHWKQQRACDPWVVRYFFSKDFR